MPVIAAQLRLSSNRASACKSIDPVFVTSIHMASEYLLMTVDQDATYLRSAKLSFTGSFKAAVLALTNHLSP
jgi:hypothetical protein